MVDVSVRQWTAGLEPHHNGAPADAPPLVWMRSLLSQSAYVALPPQPVHDLYQEWRHWTERLYLVRDANIRICFVLEEPDDADRRDADAQSDADLGPVRLLHRQPLATALLLAGARQP